MIGLAQAARAKSCRFAETHNPLGGILQKIWLVKFYNRQLQCLGDLACAVARHGVWLGPSLLDIYRQSLFMRFIST